MLFPGKNIKKEKGGEDINKKINNIEKAIQQKKISLAGMLCQGLLFNVSDKDKSKAIKHQGILKKKIALLDAKQQLTQFKNIIKKMKGVWSPTLSHIVLKEKILKAKQMGNNVEGILKELSRLK